GRAGARPRPPPPPRAPAPEPVVQPAPAPAPAPAVEPAPAPEPVQGETEKQKAERTVAQTVAAARALLADPNSECAKAIGNTPDGMSALAVLDALIHASDPRFLAMFDHDDPDPSETLNGGGVDGVIAFYKPFFGDLGPTSPDNPASVPFNDRYNTGTHDYLYVLSPDEFRVQVLLHELEHVVGTLPPDHNG